MINITVQFYASLKELINLTSVKIELEQGCNAGDLLAHLKANYISASALVDCSRVASKDEYLMTFDLLVDGEVYSIIPPVSGGI